MNIITNSYKNKLKSHNTFQWSEKYQMNGEHGSPLALEFRVVEFTPRESSIRILCVWYYVHISKDAGAILNVCCKFPKVRSIETHWYR